MTIVPSDEAIALKEWAITVQALIEGDLIMVMRKGGIVEETKEFRLITPSFYLMPAYEHQKANLLKNGYADKLEELLQQYPANSDIMKLDAYAEVVEDIEITDFDTLLKLRDLHIWSDSFAEERLKWKRSKPLHILLLRVYKLDQSLELPMTPAYTGCKSWVRLEKDVQRPAYRPVLTDNQFILEVAKVKRALSDSIDL